MSRGTTQAGTEQAGQRPALVRSPQRFNIATRLAFICPLTSQVKGSGFEVAVARASDLSGVVLSGHLRPMDWIERKASFHSKAPRD